MPTLDEQYNQIINDQRDYLAKLQEAFNKRCDEITKQAEAKLAQIPENDTENRKKIFAEQKKQLDEALKQLKQEIEASGTKTRKKLEEIHTKREESKLAELEKMMSEA